MSKDREYYGSKFTRLNVNRKAGIPAPHKPILLLAVIEMIEQEKITDNRAVTRTDCHIPEILVKSSFHSASIEYFSAILSSQG
jgi:predicted restriction endonuclease